MAESVGFCDRCGTRIPRSNSQFCSSCGAKLPTPPEQASASLTPTPANQTESLRQEYQNDPFVRAFRLRAVRNIIISLVVIVTIWSVLSFVLADGWWHQVINIFSILLVLFCLWVLAQGLTELNKKGPLAWILLMVTMLGLLVLRAIELNVLEAIF